jgi:RNA-directed DNA polymerase
MIAVSLVEQHGHINRGSENSRVMDYLRQVLTCGNLHRAKEQVKRNKGSCSIDGMRVNEFDDYLKSHWGEIKQSIGNGTYQPSKVLVIEIDKPNDGKRLLGIPTVIDRVIQQMIHHVLSLVYDVEFASYSYVFRPGKNAH